VVTVAVSVAVSVCVTVAVFVTWGTTQWRVRFVPSYDGGSHIAAGSLDELATA
jgi:hypothetical protein